MNFEEYKTQRQALMDEANSLIGQGDTDAANEKMAEVEALDDKWDAIKKALANAKALEGLAPVVDISDPGKAPGTKPVDKIDKEDKKMNMTALEAYKSDLYKTAWAKTLRKEKLTEDEHNAYQMVNEYFHTTSNTGEVVPESVATGIWTEVAEMYPFYADIAKTSVNGIYTLIQGDTSSDASWYDEDTETEDGKETFVQYTLSGCELARNIRVSWKLKEMAVEDFIPYITRRMAERMGAGLAYGVMSGAGKAESGAPEPTGIITALEAGDATQVVTYTEGALTWADITKARGLIKSGYAAGLKVYANANTIWNVLSNVTDDNGRPIFINDQTAGGVYRILGLPVEEDSSVPDGYVLFSNASRGYQINVNKQITLLEQNDNTKRATIYTGYAIIDGAPLTLNAHALLAVASAG